MMEPLESFDYWADVGFWIETNGRVAEVELLRSKGPSHGLQPVLRSIAGRIYTPVRAGGTPTYKIERFSYTSLTERRNRNADRRPFRRRGGSSRSNLTPEVSQEAFKSALVDAAGSGVDPAARIAT